MRRNLSGLPPLREVIAAHGLQARKSLGQNFLLDQNITDKIVRLCGPLAGLSVVEIGPGPGGLTRSLLHSGALRVVAVETDSRAISALEGLQQAAGDDLALVQGDALEVSLPELCEAPRAVIANLPYNIATPLLLRWMKDLKGDPATYRFMALMFQKEVAERICAVPGTKSYGRLGIVSQWLCTVKVLMDLPPSVFTPPPKVRSSIVRFVPKVLEGPQPSFDAMERVTALAFQGRRKMVRSSLKDYAAHFERLGIDPQSRAEDLSVQDYIALAQA